MEKANVAVSVVIVAVIILAVIGLVTIGTYNGLVYSEKTVEEAKAQIEAVCQRRLDLIPNLVETVKGYAKHESETLIAVIQARSKVQEVLAGVSEKKSLTKEDMAALAGSQTELSGSLKGLFALIENYPDLKANSNFLALQDQLEGTENRISVARQRYNSEVKIYNTKISAFPGVMLAGMFGFREKESFEADVKALEPVQVKF